MYVFLSCDRLVLTSALKSYCTAYAASATEYGTGACGRLQRLVLVAIPCVTSIVGKRPKTA